jgi:hypothetical protein
MTGGDIYAEIQDVDIYRRCSHTNKKILVTSQLHMQTKYKVVLVTMEISKLTRLEVSPNNTLCQTGRGLIPILFMACVCTARKANYHSYKGEATTGHWGINRNRKFLSWKEFTWISNCSGLRQFFESDEHHDQYIKDAEQSYSNTTSLFGTAMPKGLSNMTLCHGIAWAGTHGGRSTMLKNVPKLPKWQLELSRQRHKYLLPG